MWIFLVEHTTLKRKFFIKSFIWKLCSCKWYRKQICGNKKVCSKIQKWFIQLFFQYPFTKNMDQGSGGRISGDQKFFWSGDWII